MDRRTLENVYGAERCRDAEDRIARDAGIRGGQGRSPESVQESAMGWFIAVIAIACVVFMLAGCSTVSGLGRDLTAVSEGVRAEMAREDNR